MKLASISLPRAPGLLVFDRYLAMTVLGGSTLVLAILLALCLFFGFLAEMDDIGKGSYDLLEALKFVALSLPGLAYELLPVSVLIGGLLGLGNLASGSELIALRAAGVSVARIAVSVAMVAATISIGGYAIGDWIAPAATEKAFADRAAARSGQRKVGGQVWFRDGNQVIHFHELDKTSHIGEVEIFNLEDDGRLTMAGTASRVRREAGLWYLDNWQATYLADNASKTEVFSSRVWDTKLTPDILSLFVVKPESFSLQGLYRYIQYLDNNQLDSTDYQRVLWKKIVAPFGVILMALLALPFVFGPMRSAAVGQRLLVGILIGVVYYMVNKIVGDTGQVYGLSPVAAAWLPTVLLGLITLLAVRRIQ